jgi:hypothetical protein
VTSRRRTAVTWTALVVALGALGAGPGVQAATNALSIAKRALTVSGKADKHSKQALTRAQEPGPTGAQGPAGARGPAGDRGAAGADGTSPRGQDGRDMGPTASRFFVDGSPEVVLAPGADLVTVLELSQTSGSGRPLTTAFDGAVIAKAVLSFQVQGTPGTQRHLLCILEVQEGDSYEIAYGSSYSLLGLNAPEQLPIFGEEATTRGTHGVRVRCRVLDDSGPSVEVRSGTLSAWAIRIGG